MNASPSRRRADQRQTLQRVTVWTAIAALTLNAALFVQSAIEQAGVGGLQDSLVSAVSSLFPGGGLRPAPHAPTPSPPGSGVVTTGSS